MRRGPDGGRRPAETNYVVISYSGWRENNGNDRAIPAGTPLHRKARVGTPAYAPHTHQEIFPGSVMRGLREGLLLMREGDRFEFVIPPELGWGATPPPGDAPADAIVLLTVDLHAVRPGRLFRVAACAACLVPLAVHLLWPVLWPR